MHCKDLFVNDGCNWQAIEAIRKGLPEFDVVATFAFIVESIDPVNAGTLVVSTKNEKVFWVLDLVREQQTDGLERLLASIHIVSQKEVIGLWWEAAVLKQPKQVVVLSMDIACIRWSSVQCNQESGWLLGHTFSSPFGRLIAWLHHWDNNKEKEGLLCLLLSISCYLLWAPMSFQC